MGRKHEIIVTVFVSVHCSGYNCFDVVADNFVVVCIEGMKTLVILILFAVCQMASLRGRDRLKDLDIGQQIILKWFSLLFIWFRIRASGMLF